jgi:hypothetical protein
MMDVLRKLIRESLSVDVSWKLPELYDEYQEIDELKRVAEEFGIPEADLLGAFESGRVASLTDDIWRVLENTDSYDTTDEDSARSIALEYERDIASIYDAIDSGSTLPMPIVLNFKGGYYLIAGNTRLMVCRSRGITPKIFVVSV